MKNTAHTKSQFWDLKSNTYEPIQTIEHAVDSITIVKVYGVEILTASVDGHIRLYDIRKGELETDTIGHPVSHISQKSPSSLF